MAKLLSRAEEYPNISIIGNAVLLFCAENATVERGFSLMTRLKTKVRNKLSVVTVDTLMRLRLNTKKWNQYDYQSAFEKWSRGKTQRRSISQASTRISSLADVGDEEGARLMWEQEV